MKKILCSLILLSQVSYGADFTVQFSPENNSVSTEKIQDGAITASKIANGSIDDSKVSSISSSKISDLNQALPQVVTSDTMVFNFKSTPIDPNTDPIGTFNTYSKPANGQTSSILNSNPPDQNYASINTNGFYIQPRNYSTASSHQFPTRFDIYIGKNLTLWQLFAYDGLNKSGNELTQEMFQYSSAELYGIIKTYNETTGILTLDAGGIPSNSISIRAFLKKTFANSSPFGYFSFKAIKIP